MATLATVWLSGTSDYEDFEEGVKDADSFSVVIPSTNEVRWVQASDSILVGTSGDEWRIYANKEDAMISPSTATVRIQSGFGSNTVQPLVVNSVVMFADVMGRKVYELVYDDLKQKYVAPDLTALAEHITASGIVNWALQRNPDMIIWCVLYDGSLISMTYNREQNIIAWADHTIDGTVQSVCVVPNETAGEDNIYISVLRGTVTSIEKFSSRVYPASTVAFASQDNPFLDSYVLWEDTASNTITDTRFASKVVSVLALSGSTVTEYANITALVEGVITLPNAATCTKAYYGLPYTTEVQPMRMDGNSGNGSTHGSLKRIAEIVTSLMDSKSVKYGDSTTNLHDIDTTSSDLVNSSTNSNLFTGDVTLTMDGGFNVNDPIVISTSSCYPMTLRCIVARTDVTGR